MEPSEEFLIPILQKMIQIPTENPPSLTKDLVDYLYTLFPSEKGFRKKIFTNTKDGYELHNIVVELGSGPQKIVLCGHLDTVPAGSKTNWTHDPFTGKVENGNVYGRGSADMKGGVVSIIGVLFSFLDNEEFLKKYTLIFAGTADEEAGMSGAEEAEKQGVMDGAVVLIVPEATNYKVGIAEKGVTWVKLLVHGKQAHGSMPDQGINAIEAAASVYSQLHDCLSGVSSEILGKSTLNIGTITGGTKINVVPNLVEIELDFRLIPEEDQELVLKKLHELKPALGNCEVELIQNLPALISKKSDFVSNLSKIVDSEPIGLTYGTDAAKLLKNKDIPFVIFGPGDNTVIHKDNEFVPAEQVVGVSKFLIQALKETFL